MRSWKESFITMKLIKKPHTYNDKVYYNFEIEFNGTRVPVAPVRSKDGSYSSYSVLCLIADEEKADK